MAVMAAPWETVLAEDLQESEQTLDQKMKSNACDTSDDEHSTFAGSEDERGSGSEGAPTPATMSPAETNVEPSSPSETNVEPSVDFIQPDSGLPAWITARPGLEVVPPPASVPPGFARLPWHHAGAAEDEPCAKVERPTAYQALMAAKPMIPPSPTVAQLQVADDVARIVLAEESASSEEDMPAAFDKVAFHKELSNILRDLVCASSAGAAVQQIRTWRVPKDMQAAEFTDLLTRASEEGRGLARRRCFTLAAGLAAGTPSAFAKDECLAGISAFFKEVYQGLCLEVPRLPAIAANEMIPTLAAVLPKKKLRPLLPRGLESALAQSTK
jgi:hypothetical protein